MLRYPATLFFSFLFFIFAPNPAEAIKPRPPIELRFSYRYLSETEIRISLIALANVVGEKVVLQLERPLGLRLIEGEDYWEGSMKKGEQIRIEVIVQQGASSSYKVLGRASIRPRGGGIFRQERRLTLDQTGEKTLKHRPPISRKGARNNILEFRD